MRAYKTLGSLLIGGALALVPSNGHSKATNHTHHYSKYGIEQRARDLHFFEPEGRLSANVSIHRKNVKRPNVPGCDTRYSVVVKGHMSLNPPLFRDLIHTYIDDKIRETIAIYDANGNEVVDLKNKIVNKLGSMKEYTIVLEYQMGHENGEINLYPGHIAPFDESNEWGLQPYSTDYKTMHEPLPGGTFSVPQEIAIPLIHYADAHYLRMEFDNTLLELDYRAQKEHGVRTKKAITKHNQKKARNAPQSLKSKKRERMGYRKLDTEKWIRAGDKVELVPKCASCYEK